MSAELPPLGEPPVQSGLNTIVILQNIPQVPEGDRMEKVRNILMKVCSAFGTIVDLFIAQNEKKETTGFAFIEYATPEQASVAITQGTGYALDKKHVFAISSMADFDAIVNTPNILPPRDTKIPPLENPQWWLQNEFCEDQFVVTSGAKNADMLTTVFVNSKGDSTAAKKGERKQWTDSHVRWSPRGTYLATFHRPGINLWSGPSFTRKARFAHNDVRLIGFSPCENYVATCSDSTETGDIVLWDVTTGQKTRTLPYCAKKDGPVGDWPVLKWAHSGKFFARLGDAQTQTLDAISIFETPSLFLLNKKSVPIKGVKDFSWSPTDNFLAYWVLDEKERSGKVVILSVPDMKEVTAKSLFNVQTCKMYWQDKGDFLCVQVDRIVKGKKSSTTFELFHIRERMIPCDILEVKDRVEDFSWEPSGNKLCVTHGEGALSFSFYQLQQSGVTLLKPIEGLSATRLIWSPRGQFCVAALLGTAQGTVSFIDTATMSVTNSLQQPMVSQVQWDPTGRYVAASVDAYHSEMDNGFDIYSFQGEWLEKRRVQHMRQFIWRPRPPTLLPPAEVEKIRKNLDSYKEVFAAQDRVMKSKTARKRRAVLDEWAEYFADRRAVSRQLQDRLAAMRPHLRQGRAVESEELVEVHIRDEVQVLTQLD